MIISKSNPKVVQARALRQRKEREATGQVLVEGIAQVGAALEAAADVDCILYAPELLKSDFAHGLLKQAGERSIPVLEISAEVCHSLSDRDHPAGLLAVAARPPASLESLAAGPTAWYVALVSPQDPGNVGAVLRTVDAVGAGGLLLLDGGVDAGHPAAVRASLGALFFKPVVAATFLEFTDWVKRKGFGVTGTSARGDIDYASALYRRPLILLLGSEQKGLTAEQRAVCDQLIRLPMQGRVSSLNLAVAAGVLLYTVQSRLS